MGEEDEKYHLPTPDLSAFGDAGPSSADEPDPTPSDEPKPADTTSRLGHGPAGSPTGTLRFQQRGSTTPRPPTLAEQRFRQEAEEETEREQAEAQAVVAGRARRRRRVMIGGGVTVGVVAVIGAWYLLASPQDVTAQCTVAAGSETDTIVTDQNCDPAYATAHGGYVNNGFVFLPIGGGRYQQYHYYYGGSGTIGQRATGGSFTAPDNANVHTPSGKTVQRGGFGITGKVGGSGGGESGGGGKSGGS